MSAVSNPKQVVEGKPPAAEDPLAHWPRVFGFALSLTRDRGRAEDLCQEAYLRLLDRADRLDTSRPLLPLLLTMVRNLAVSEHRRSRSAPLADDERIDREVDDRAEDPADLAVRAETVDSVREALDRLPDNWRAALYLRDGLGFSYRDIGDVIEASTDTVRTLLHRARERMRQSMSGQRLSGRRPE